MSNLNDLRVWDVDESGYTRKTEASSVDGNTIAYFDHLEDRLIEHIKDADAVVGCVAWLTNERILDAMATCKHVSILVQKEDFLRPDLNPQDNWRKTMRQRYDNLPTQLMSYEFGSLIGDLNYLEGFEMHKVRCVGNLNTERNPAFPRSHHKFVVFGKIEEAFGEDTIENESFPYRISSFEPYAVWTGSFNFTVNATRSFENALYLTDENIVRAYVDEFSHIYALSEPLDWDTAWDYPEFRIGT